MEDMKAPQSKQAKLLHVDNQVSIEAQLLLPVKTLAYGVPLHTFMDYFQMQKAYARDSCRQFDVVIKKI
jgi:hypothetical protein